PRKSLLANAALPSLKRFAAAAASAAEGPASVERHSAVQAAQNLASHRRCRILAASFSRENLPLNAPKYVTSSGSPAGPLLGARRRHPRVDAERAHRLRLGGGDLKRQGRTSLVTSMNARSAGDCCARLGKHRKIPGSVTAYSSSTASSLPPSRSGFVP